MGRRQPLSLRRSTSSSRQVWYYCGMNQIDIYRKITGEERLEQAFQLSENLRKSTLDKIRKKYPYFKHKQHLLILRGRLDQIEL